MRHLRLGTTLTLAIVCARMTHGGTAPFAVVDLGTIGGADVRTAPGLIACALAENGDVVGHGVVADGAEEMHPVLWAGGGVIDLGPLPGDPHALARSVNDVGVAVGTSYRLGAVAPTAVRWTSQGPPTALGAFAAVDVNAAGTVVGEMPQPPYGARSHAVAWRAGLLTDLGTLGGIHSAAYAVNEQERIVGMSFVAADDPRTEAVLWQNASMIALGGLGGTRSFATDLNEHGQIVGAAETASGDLHAFLIEVDEAGAVTTRTDLGVLSGRDSRASGINAGGQVVGVSNGHAFLWDGGEMTDLNDLLPANSGWELFQATAINDRGSIAGFGVHDGAPRAFRLDPSVFGDLDADGDVDFADLLLLLTAWGPCDACPADLDGDGEVGLTDLLQLLANWG